MIFEAIETELKAKSYNWLVTGCAGFIGSHLVESLLNLGQQVVGLDNFSTGYQSNLDDVRSNVGEQRWQSFTFIEGDITHPDTCNAACRNIDFVLHQAALGSVPRSIENPMATNAANITGFLNMLTAAKDQQVKRFVYAASSSTYGDSKDLPKREDRIGKPLSPYAVTKLANELYADVFAKVYGMQNIGLRYFNVFGPRQNPHGAYAAVIPTWIMNLLSCEQVFINGDGLTSRDFCFVENVVQINLRAALTTNESAINQVYNVAVGENTSLNELYQQIANYIGSEQQPVYRDNRLGDIAHSLADITKATELLGYQPTYTIAQGLPKAIEWYVRVRDATIVSEIPEKVVRGK